MSAPIRPVAGAVAFLLALAGWSAVANAQVQMETRVGTSFHVFAPPNNDVSNRFSAIIITAISGSPDAPTSVALIDDGADGDYDDSISITLERGESLVRYIKDGTTNDDYSGAWDGDEFRIFSSAPVSVCLVTDSDWQHDWAPSDNGTLRGTSFWLFANKVSVTPRDANVFAYEHNTRVSIYDVTDVALSGSGVARVLDELGDPIMTADLNEGEDLNLTYGLGYDLFEHGHTYRVVASKPVTVLYGAIGSLASGAGSRDGGGFVPGSGGGNLDDLFYFTVPHDGGRPYEQEIRIVSYDDGVDVALEGYDEDLGDFAPIQSWALDAYEHADYVGGPTRIFRVRATGGEVTVFEANWLETGAPGTSDVASFAAGRSAADGSYTQLVYVGPPGTQSNTALNNGRFSHLYIASRGGEASLRVTDADTNGTIVDDTLTIPASGMVDVAIDLDTWNQLNRPSEGIRPWLRIEASSLVSVQSTNWNDNWMAYATAVRPANPAITLDLPAAANTGETITLAADVTNDGQTPLTNVDVSVELPAEITFVAGTLVGDAATGVDTSADDGSTRVNFELASLDGGESATLDIDVSVGEVDSGTVTNIAVVAAGTDGIGNPIENTAGAAANAPVLLLDDRVASLSNLGATPEDRAVLVSVDVDATTSGASTVYIETASDFDGPWTELVDARTVVAGAQTVVYRHTGLPNNRTRYYRVIAEGGGGSMAQLGPVAARPADNDAPPAPGLSARAGIQSVALTFAGPFAVDHAGLHVERALSSSGPWTRITTSLATGTGLLVDNQTPGETLYFRAVSVDDDGNSSPRSAVVSATPLAAGSRVERVLVMFEDMIGLGNNDWDYNDFVVDIEAVIAVDGEGVSGIVLSYDALARGAGFEHRFVQRIEIVGGWSASLEVRDASGAVVDMRNYSGTGDLIVPIWEDTRDALPDQLGSYANTPLAQASFVDGQSARLTVSLEEPEANPDAVFGEAPYDPYLVLPWRDNAEVHLVEQGGASEVVNRPGPLLGQWLGFAQTIRSPELFAWPFEGEAVWISFPDIVPWVLEADADYERWLSAPTSLENVFHTQRQN